MALLQTKRLILRKLQSTDLSDMTTLLSAWEVTKWTVMIPFPYVFADAQAYFQTVQSEYDADNLYYLVIADRQTNRMIGSITMPPITPDRINEREIGFWLGMPYWSSGYMTETVQATLEWLFHNTHTVRTFAYTNPVNHPSQNVLTKTGFHYIGILPREKPNRFRGSATVAMWELLREDYIKAHPLPSD